MAKNCSILSQKVPKFELYKHNDELFKSIKILKIWWKKGNNSNMSNGIYFKNAG
jgi:hypothetical protein